MKIKGRSYGMRTCLIVLLKTKQATIRHSARVIHNKHISRDSETAHKKRNISVALVLTRMEQGHRVLGIRLSHRHRPSNNSSNSGANALGVSVGNGNCSISHTKRSNRDCSIQIRCKREKNREGDVSYTTIEHLERNERKTLKIPTFSDKYISW